MALKELKYIPSRTKHYLSCPYILKLSNIVKISVDEPHILGIRKTQMFKDHVINGMGKKKKAIEPVRVKNPIDIVMNKGLILIAKKIDTVFFSTSEIGLNIEMFRPDIIETSQVGERIEVNVKSIRNISSLSSYHYLQAFVYKLALEKALKGTTMKPVEVVASIVHWKSDYNPFNEDGIDEDLEVFQSYLCDLSNRGPFIEERIGDKHQFCLDSLRNIASLAPQEDLEKCEYCIGSTCCDVYNEIEFFDKYKWFDKFEQCQ